MANVLNAIVLAASGLAQLPLLSQYIAPPDQITTVRVILGQPVNNTGGASGGDIPGVTLWDRFGHPIGTTFSSSNRIPESDFADIKVVANNKAHGSVPAEYISITSGGNDAICVAGLTVTFPGGGHAAWTADIAAACPNTGAFVFPSKVQIAADHQQGNQNVRQSPHCVWIDRDGSNGIPHQGFGVHLPDFGGEVTVSQKDAYLANDDLMCRSRPRFRMYQQLRAENPILIFEPPLAYDNSGKDIDPSKVINNPGVFAEQDVSALQKACNDNSKLSECTSLPKNPVVSVIHEHANNGRRSARYRARPRYSPLQSGPRLDGRSKGSASADSSSTTGATQTRWTTSGLTTTSGWVNSQSTSTSGSNSDWISSQSTSTSGSNSDWISSQSTSTSGSNTGWASSQSTSTTDSNSGWISSQPTSTTDSTSGWISSQSTSTSGSNTGWASSQSTSTTDSNNGDLSSQPTSMSGSNTGWASSQSTSTNGGYVSSQSISTTNSKGGYVSSQPASTSGSKPDNSRAKHRFHGHLVVSNHDYHSAKQVCQHPNSFGPSFASIPEKMFCDMVEKKLYPICVTKKTGSCCFDIDAKELWECSDKTKASGLSPSVTRFVEVPSASSTSLSAAFSNVQYW